MEIQSFFDNRTWTVTYVVFDPSTRDAVIIDPVLDYEPQASKVWTESVDAVVRFCQGRDLNVRWILETHAHADHLSGSVQLRHHFPQARLAIGERITDVQKMFKNIFDLPAEFPTDGSQFDRLLRDGEHLEAGSLVVEVINTPGHTPACVSFKIEDALFTGDALFMPDMGTGRCDFPGGNAEALYESIQRLYRLPEETRVFVGHDYGPGGRDMAWETTIAAEKAGNVHVKADTDQATFVEFRRRRDATLEAPRLLFQSVQVNVDAGRLPEAHPNSIRYLRIPINVFRPEPGGEVELRDAHAR